MQATAHMVYGGNDSAPELELLALVRQVFPSATKIQLGKRRGFGNSFELDIYVSELKKGIEFNGTYYHSMDGLRRSRPTWPEEMLKNYHQLKQDFFKDRGIQIIYISEVDWKRNKQQCIDIVMAFLQEGQSAISARS
jgi:hypothetical protein